VRADSRRTHIAFLLGLWMLVLALPALAAPAPLRALPDFTPLVESNATAVVNISTTQAVKRPSWPGGEAPETPEGSGPFNDFLRRYFGEEELPPELFDNKSLGSGFLVSPDGFVLTCAHVVENATEILVRLTDRREFTAKVIGADRRSDVALLKIDATGLPQVRIGDPEKVRVGEWVLAIGSPFGFESSATAGIVSAKGRSLPRENYVPFIQTDVAINPGNSGGPLFNLQGEVIGINSQIYSRTGGFMGLSFAVPIDIAMQVAKQLKASGRVKRGWIGVTIQDVTRELAESFGMKRPYGALIADVLADGPAAKSDLRVGDVVVEYEGHRINLSADLPPLVGQTSPGTRARLGIIRNGQAQAASVTVAELPEEVGEARPETPPGPERPGVLGMQLKDLTPAQRKQLGVSQGVLVEKVAEGPALKAGVRPGDVILQVQGRPMRSAGELRELAPQLPRNKPVPVLVRRGAAALFLALRIPE
jgi:serine protease Do